MVWTSHQPCPLRCEEPGQGEEWGSRWGARGQTGAKERGQGGGCEIEGSPGTPKAPEGYCEQRYPNSGAGWPQGYSGPFTQRSLFPVSQVTKPPKSSYHGSWGDKSCDAQGAICLQGNEKETFRGLSWGSQPLRRGAAHTLGSPSGCPSLGSGWEARFGCKVMRLQTQCQSRALLCGAQRESMGRQKASKGDSAPPQEKAVQGEDTPFLGAQRSQQAELRPSTRFQCPQQPRPRPQPAAPATLLSGAGALPRVQVPAPHGLRDAWVSPGYIIFSGQRPQPAEHERERPPHCGSSAPSPTPLPTSKLLALSMPKVRGEWGEGGTGDASQVLP